MAYARDPGSESGSATHVAALGVELEVDEETGEVKVLKFASSLSVGKTINEQSAHGQNEGELPMHSATLSPRRWYTTMAGS